MALLPGMRPMEGDPVADAGRGRGAAWLTSVGKTLRQRVGKQAHAASGGAGWP